MNLLFQPGNTRTTAGLDRMIEARLIALAERLRVDEAVVRLNDHREASPRYTAYISLRVPGPDIHAVVCDHTLRVAVAKALAAVERQVTARRERRLRRRRATKPVAGSGSGRNR